MRAHFYPVAEHMRILLLLVLVAFAVEAEAQDIQFRMLELPPPTTFAGLRQLDGPAPSGSCAFPTVALSVDSLKPIALGDTTTLRLPADWRTRPLLPGDDEYTHTGLTAPGDNRVWIRRQRNGARSRQHLMYPSGERPEGVTCTVDRGQAGAIWSLYVPDPQSRSTGARNYAALGAVITPAGFWYSVSLSTSSAADQSRLASILTEAMLLDPGSTAQCLRFKQPLGYSASGVREQGDTAWYVLQLADKGTVSRPLFPQRQREMWTRQSRWTTPGDTLLIRVFDGLVGWDISLWRAREGWTGVATYLTDVIAAGWVPPRLDVSAVAIKCPAPPA